MGLVMADMENDIVINLSGVTRDFHDGEKWLHILRGVDLQVRAGECVAIIGRSGTGKSTLLNILGLLDRQTSGSVSVSGYDYARLSERQRTSLRGKAIGFIFQQHHLLNDLNALDNVLVAGNFRHGKHTRKEARTLLENVGMGERIQHPPAKLSGGEQQRVAIARALFGNPPVLLCDEPTGNLDPETGREVMNILWQQVRERGRAMVLVTHDMQIAARADRILKLSEGRLIQQELASSV